ncbi:MAG: selenium metabolism-associated LysR family transcriptional regulator [Thermodesulfobacteriota bacterium]|jgi:DNA-binding transcriptional LysR family regulator
MDIHQLRIFASVYRNRSFSKASEQLFISQPTISEHIKNLEKSLGCTLFDRLGRKIEPTGEADLIFPKALQLIEDLERINDLVLKSSQRVKGKLYIGASTIPGNYMLPVLAANFRNQYPEVSFEIVIADTRKITDMLVSHEFFLGIVGASMEPKILNYEPFLDDELVFAGTPKYMADMSNKPLKIHQVPFLLREEGSGTRKTMEDFLQKMQINLKKMNVVAVLGSTDAIKHAIKAGLGTSILSRRAIAEELANGSLLEIKLGEEMKRSFYLATHKKRTLPAQYKAFYDFLLARGE